MEGPEKRPWWSVKVSGVLRLFLITFVGLWAVAVIVQGAGFVWQHWTTRSEKRAALHALDCVDAVRDASGGDEGTYQVKLQTAKNAVEVTQRVAFTGRDQWIGTYLNVLLLTVDVQRDLATRMPTFTDKEKEKPELADALVEQAQMRQMSILEEQTLRQILGAKASGR